MGKMQDLHKIISDDKKLMEEYTEIISEVVTNKSVPKLSRFAERLGITITNEEIKSYFSDRELDEEELESVAGGVHNNYALGPFSISYRD